MLTGSIGQGGLAETLKNAVTGGNPLSLIMTMLSTVIELGKGLLQGSSISQALSPTKLSKSFASKFSEDNSAGTVDMKKSLAPGSSMGR